MTPFLASLLLAGPPLPLSMQALDLAGNAAVTSAISGGEVHTADLSWPGEVRIEMENTADEIVVRFDRPIDDSEIQRFAKEASKDLADLRWNDTSLVLRAASGRRVEAVADGRVLRVRFLPDEVADPSSVVPPQGSDREIEFSIARAQVDAAAGYPGRARRRLAQLAESHSDNRQVQRSLADAEVADGALASAAMRYRDIAADDPFALRAIAEAGGNVTASLTIRGGKVFSQGEGNLNGLVRVGPRLAVGGGVRHFRTHADTVVGPAGALLDVDSRSTVGDLFAVVNVGSKTRLEFQGSAQFNKDVVGGGMRLFAGSQERQARLILAYRLPDLATPEQSTFGGHISRIGIGGTLRLSPELVVQGDAAWNGYGLANMGVRSETFSVTAGLDYLLRRGSPSLAIAYRLDAEYVDRARKRANGQAFIPLSDRENHSLQLVSSLSLSKVQLTGSAGWTIDRIGNSNGPSANISAAARLGNKWRLDASGGISSVSRPGISGRQLYMRLALTRYLGRR